MNSATKKELTPPLRYDFECEELFYGDVWNYFESSSLLAQINKRKYLRERFHTNSLDFSNIINLGIKYQLKYYLAKHVDDKEPFPPLFSYYYHTKKMILFFGEYAYMGVKQITDIPFEELMNDWEKWLVVNDYAIKSKSYYINSKLEKKQRNYSSDCINAMKIFYFAFMNFDDTFHFDDDIWILSKMPIKLDIPVTQNIKSVSFSTIKQQKLKYIIKKYIYFLMQTKPIGTVRSKLSYAKSMSDYFATKQPNVSCLNDMNYESAEKYLIWLTTESGFTARRIAGQKHILQELLEYNYQNMWEPVDEYIILPDLNQKRKTKEPRPYSDEELNAINLVLHQLPIQIARIVSILQFVGIRISDICKMKVSNYRIDDNHTKYLAFTQQKTSENTLIVCEGIVCELIEAAIETSRIYTNGKSKYIFCDENGKIITPHRINTNLKKLAYNNKLLDKDGNPFNITTHRFRMTVATDFAKLGFEPDVIARLLGHKSLKSLNNYISVRESDYVETMLPLMELKQKKISSAGNINSQFRDQTKQDSLGIPLPNGTCFKPTVEGKCKHANVCYECRMFKPNKKYLSVYKYHLKSAKTNLLIAQDNGFQRQIQINSDLIMALNKIIKKVEENEDI